MPKILIIDDEISILESLEMFLIEKGYSIQTAASAAEGMTRLTKFEPDVVILDIRLPDRSGFEVLECITALMQPPKVIMITAFHDMATAITSMKIGAYDYIHKPLDADEIEGSVDKALRAIKAERATPIASESDGEGSREIIIGKSRCIVELFKTIGVLCQNDATALIQGETGTGKELIARVIHKNSRNASAPFITVDCGAVVETLLESELFGHEKGAFTGAAYTKPGKIELAANGTLFLDEIGELSLNLQSKLLGFLERREFIRVGGQYPRQSFCRIIAATHRDLSQMVQCGQFREDLYYRLHVVTIFVPPLRERLGDIAELTHHFLKHINRSMPKKSLCLQHGVIPALMAQKWPGNVRELKNLITAAAARCRGNVILREDIEALLSRRQPETVDTASSLADMEQRHILKTLKQVNWNRTHAARLLDISLPTLRSKIRKYKMEPSTS